MKQNMNNYQMELLDRERIRYKNKISHAFLDNELGTYELFNILSIIGFK